jgi:hypothetical protein
MNNDCVAHFRFLDAHSSILSGWVELIGTGYLVLIQRVRWFGGLTCFFAGEKRERKMQRRKLVVSAAPSPAKVAGGMPRSVSARRATAMCPIGLRRMRSS